MKKLCVLLLFMSLLFSGCYMSNTVSDFVKTDIELGITKDDFIKKFGEPYSINKEVNKAGDYQEVLFYKEELYREAWYIVTTSFVFVNGKLEKQEVVNEERMFFNNAKEGAKKANSSSKCKFIVFCLKSILLGLKTPVFSLVCC